MSENKDFKPGVSINTAKEEKKEEGAMPTVEDKAFSEEETTNQLLANEEDFLQGLLDAAGYSQEETQRIEIIRGKKLFFAFTIRALSEEEYDKCKKKHTKYVRNRHLGVKMPEDTNSVKYRAALIYNATVEEDRKKLWDNKQIWDALRNKGFQIMNGLDVIEYSLKAGEKDRVIECIDRLSGYEDNLEEVTKN